MNPEAISLAWLLQKFPSNRKRSKNVHYREGGNLNLLFPSQLCPKGKSKMKLLPPKSRREKKKVGALGICQQQTKVFQAGEGARSWL